jgi:hypothetical protein
MCGATPAPKTARAFWRSTTGTLFFRAGIWTEELIMPNDNWGNQSTKIWLGIAIGAAVGLGIALSRRRPASRWDSAREFSKRISDRSGDLAEATQDIVQRMRNIYEEGRKVVEDAGDLWAHGRKMVGV